MKLLHKSFRSVAETMVSHILTYIKSISIVTMVTKLYVALMAEIVNQVKFIEGKEQLPILMRKWLKKLTL